MATKAAEDEFVESIFVGLPPVESAAGSDEFPENEDELSGESAEREESLKNADGSEVRLCKECGVNQVFRKGTRGRWPSYCDDCKRPRTGGTPKRAKPNTLNSRLDHIAKGLSHNIALAGIGVTYVAPTAGYVVCDGADYAGKAIVELAKDRPAVLAALETAAKVGPGVELFKWLVTIGTAIAVDFGQIPPDQILAQFLGVTDAYHKTHSRHGEAHIPSVSPVQSFTMEMPDIPSVA